LTQTPESWLWTSGGPDEPHDLGRILRTYRGVYQLTQRELADFLGFDQSYVSKLESGNRRVRDIRHLQLIGERLGIPVDELAHAAGMLDQDGAPQLVGTSQWQWRLVRQGLNRHRADLAEVAAALYPGAQRVGAAPLLVRPDWLPDEPVDLADVVVAWAADVPPPRSPAPKPRSRARGRCPRVATGTSATAERSATSTRRGCSRTGSATGCSTSPGT